MDRQNSRTKYGSRHKYLAGIATSAMLIAAAPAFAAPQTAREAELESRLERLEAAYSNMNNEVLQLRAEQEATAAKATAAADASAQAGQKVAALEAKPTAPLEGFNVGGTTVKINGFIKANASFSRYSDGDAATGSLIKDFYVPGQVPVGGVREGNDFTGIAKQSRFWLTTATPVGKKMLKGHLEFDFQTASGTQGSQRTTNGYNFALRRGFFTYDRLLVGQEWSNFQYVAALPESTDFVGPTEGTVFVRQAQVRYAFPLSKQATLTVSLESPETASITTGSPTMIENDDDRMPDVTARLNYAGSFGELSLAGIVRQLSVDNTVSNKVIGDNVTGWGISAAGKIPFGANKQHDFRFMATYGDGIGRYLGLNFAPDAVLASAATGRLETVKNFAGLAAVRLGWTKVVRSTFMAGYQKADYPNGILIPGLANLKSWSVAGNLFWSPAKGFDVGGEYRHGEREVVNGLTGQFDRLEFVAKYSF